VYLKHSGDEQTKNKMVNKKFDIYIVLKKFSPLEYKPTHWLISTYIVQKQNTATLSTFSSSLLWLVRMSYHCLILTLPYCNCNFKLFNLVTQGTFHILPVTFFLLVNARLFLQLSAQFVNMTIEHDHHFIHSICLPLCVHLCLHVTGEDAHHFFPVSVR